MIHGISTFALVLIFICLNQFAAANDFSDFLRRKAVSVDSVEFSRSKHEFLSHQMEKGRAKWFDGSIVTNESQRYEQLKLKFNVLNNSLYVNFDGVIYRVPNFALKEFVITQKGETMTFRKGYTVTSTATISATFKGSSQKILTFLNTYTDFKTLNIKQISLSQNDVNELNISLTEVSRSQVTALKNFIDSNDNIKQSTVEFDIPRIEENRYLQVLYENDLFVVLKYHFKKTATTEAVSLVKVSDGFLIAEEDYFLAGTNKRLVEFMFTKKSLEKSLNTLNLTYENELRNVGSVSRALKWFEENSFSLGSN